MYNTLLVSRREVIPRALIEHSGKAWRVSANTERGLYIHRLSENKRISDDFIPVIANEFGISEK